MNWLLFTRVALGLLGVAAIAAFMWGLRTIIFSMGHDFAIGAAFGAVFVFGLLWLHHKVTGKNVFTSD